MAESLARLLARVAFAARLPARRRLESNLARLDTAAAPSQIRSRAARTFEEFGVVVADFLRLGSTSAAALQASVVVHGAAHLATARAAGRGCLLVSSPCGGWVWGAALLADRGAAVRLLARPHASGAVERFFRERRARWGVAALDCAHGWTEPAAALRRGDWLALMTDRAVPGLHGSVCAWAATLARRTGAIVLPVAMTRLADGRQAMWCERPLEPSHELELALGAVLRRQLARAGEQWFAFAPLPEGLA